MRKVYQLFLIFFSDFSQIFLRFFSDFSQIFLTRIPEIPGVPAGLGNRTPSKTGSEIRARKELPEYKEAPGGRVFPRRRRLREIIIHEISKKAYDY